MVRRIAIIPARGGSKRIPEKNIYGFNGKPMIAWTIEAALASKLFDRVLVSTDSTKIAAVAKRFGAEVPFLRESHCDDFSIISEATVAALTQAKEYWEEEYDIVVQLMANCPLRDANDIVKSVEYFESEDVDFQISCFKYGWMNPWWAAKLGSKGEPEPIFQDALSERSQDLPELYCPTGATWIASTSALMSSHNFYGKGHTFFPMNWSHAVDIDDYDDLVFAESVAMFLKAKG